MEENHLKYLLFGEKEVRSLDNFIKEISNPVIIRKVFPNLCDPCAGVKYGEVHSYFITYLGVLGASLGYIPIVEPTILNITTKIYTGEKTQESKKPDTVWKNLTQNSRYSNFAFFEFEGVSSANHLIGKTKNLIKMYEDAENKPNSLILMYWKQKGQIIKDDVKKCRDVFSKGFVIDKVKIPKPDAQFFIIETRIVRNRVNTYYFDGFVLIE